MSLSNNNGEYLAIDFGTCNSVISLIQKRFYKKLKIIYVSKP
jgi:molecular chaperone DnaK (HSP70)